MERLILIKVTIPHRAFLTDKHPIQIIADHLRDAGVKWNAAGFTDWDIGKIAREDITN